MSSPQCVCVDSIRAMSGHSKWSQIKRQKGAADVKRGVVFTKMTREIMLAAREGGGDPEANFRLRLALDRARAVNMPHANIQRAIDRATGADGGAAFTRNGGKLGESGSVQWLFEQKGIIEIDAGKRSPDEVSLIAIDSGAEDVEELDDVQKVHANFDVPDEVLQHA